jgi:hypothetical protein
MHSLSMHGGVYHTGHMDQREEIPPHGQLMDDVFPSGVPSPGQFRENGMKSEMMPPRGDVSAPRQLEEMRPLARQAMLWDVAVCVQYVQIGLARHVETFHPPPRSTAIGQVPLLCHSRVVDGGLSTAGRNTVVQCGIIQCNAMQ